MKRALSRRVRMSTWNGANDERPGSRTAQNFAGDNPRSSPLRRLSGDGLEGEAAGGADGQLPPGLLSGDGGEMANLTRVDWWALLVVVVELALFAYFGWGLLT